MIGVVALTGNCGRLKRKRCREARTYPQITVKTGFDRFHLHASEYHPVADIVQTRGGSTRRVIRKNISITVI